MIVPLALLAVLEIGTLATLLVNLAFFHVPALAKLIGPIHGSIYLIVVITLLLAPGFRRRDRLLGFVPVIGGVLALIGLLRKRTNPDVVLPVATSE